MTKPIFLHGMWRSGSTYLWSCFRENIEAYCFYEPLHQGLGKITHNRILRDTTETNVANAHPSLSKPYFSEYAPLIKKRGLTGFDKAFGYKSFIMSKDDNYPGLETYIKSLLSYASSQQKQAVLGFNRTNLRLGWMKKTFDSTHIYIDRNPRDIFASYMKFLKQGNYTFFVCWLLILEHNRDKLPNLLHDIPTRSKIQSKLLKYKEFYKKIIDHLSAEDLYKMIFTFWILCALDGLKNSDIILDMNRGQDANYIQNTEDSIQQMTGLKIDLSALSSPIIEDKTLPFQDIENQVLENLDTVSLNTNLLKDLHPQKQTWLSRI